MTNELHRVRWPLCISFGAVYVWLNVVTANGAQGFPLPFRSHPGSPSELWFWWSIPINVGVGIGVLPAINSLQWMLAHKWFCWGLYSLFVARLNLMGFEAAYDQRFGIPFAWFRSGIDTWEYSWWSLLLNIMIAFFGMALLVRLRERELHDACLRAKIPPSNENG